MFRVPSMFLRELLTPIIAQAKQNLDIPLAGMAIRYDTFALRAVRIEYARDASHYIFRDLDLIGISFDYPAMKGRMTFTRVLCGRSIIPSRVRILRGIVPSRTRSECSQEQAHFLGKAWLSITFNRRFSLTIWSTHCKNSEKAFMLPRSSKR